MSITVRELNKIAATLAAATSLAQLGERIAREQRSLFSGFATLFIEVPKFELPRSYVEMGTPPLSAQALGAVAGLTDSVNRLAEQVTRQTLAPMQSAINQMVRQAVLPIASFHQAIDRMVRPLAGTLRLLARRLPYIAAEAALSAVLRDDEEEFTFMAGRIIRGLVTQEKLEALALALLEQDWCDVGPDEVFKHLRERARYHYLNGGKPLWERKLNGHYLSSLDQTVNSWTALTLGEQAVPEPDPAEQLLGTLQAEAALRFIATKLSSLELQIFKKRLEGLSWGRAAEEAGVTDVVGQSLRRKLTRWRDQGAIPGLPTRDDRTRH